MSYKITLWREPNLLNNQRQALRYMFLLRLILLIIIRFYYYFSSLSTLTLTTPQKPTEVWFCNSHYLVDLSLA